MITVALFDPQIPPNTGNIARLCAATDTRLHIVGEIGFDLSDKQLRRAGLDYWEHVNWERFDCVDTYVANLDMEKTVFLTTKSPVGYTHKQYSSDTTIVFGSETQGIRDDILRKYSQNCATIPMKNKVKGVRSLNLSTSVGIVLYEAIRQVDLSA